MTRKERFEKEKEQKLLESEAEEKRLRREREEDMWRGGLRHNK